MDRLVIDEYSVNDFRRDVHLNKPNARYYTELITSPVLKLL